MPRNKKPVWSVLNDSGEVVQVDSFYEALGISQPAYYVIHLEQTVYEDDFNFGFYRYDSNLLLIVGFLAWLRESEQRTRDNFLRDDFCLSEIAAIQWEWPRLSISPATASLKKFCMEGLNPTNYPEPAPYASFEAEGIPIHILDSGLADLDVETLKRRNIRKHQALDVLNAFAEEGMDQALELIMRIESVATFEELAIKIGISIADINQVSESGNFFSLGDAIFPETRTIPEEYFKS